jgi:hypothetical protein
VLKAVDPRHLRQDPRALVSQNAALPTICA